MPKRGEPCVCHQINLKHKRYCKLKKQIQGKLESKLKTQKLIDTPPSELKPKIEHDVVDSVDSGESLFKLLIFEPINYTNETDKCVAFWDYIRSRGDLKPKPCTILNLKEKPSKQIVKEQISKNDITNFTWEDALTEIRKRNLHKLAMATTKPLCKFCKDPFDKYAHVQTTEEEKKEIEALNYWRPTQVTNAQTQTSSIQLIDKFTNNQSTESFKVMYERNKAPEYQERGNDAQNFESLMLIWPQVDKPKRKGSKLKYDEICTCGMDEKEECPYHIPDCTCETLDARECPYHKINCTCGISDSTECPYHKISCTCGSDATECPYHKISCTCGSADGKECPYHKINCTCGSIDGTECLYHKINCTCGIEGETECPYHKINCTCGSSEGKECPYHKISCTCGSDEGKECPYHKIQCTCGSDEGKECPYHKIQCTCGSEQGKECPYHKIQCTCGSEEGKECPYHKIQCTCGREEGKECPYHKIQCTCGNEEAIECPYHKVNCTCSLDGPKDIIDHVADISECPYHKINCTCGLDLNQCSCGKTKMESTYQKEYNVLEELQDIIDIQNCTCKTGSPQIIHPEEETMHEEFECPYHKPYCVCGETSSLSICPYNEKDCTCGKPVECPYHVESCTCSELIPKLHPECPHIEEYCKCGKRILTCSCKIDTECLYHKEECVCGSTVCPYNIENCDCGKEKYCTCDHQVLKCPHNSKTCSCNDEIYPCPYGMINCQCKSESLSKEKIIYEDVSQENVTCDNPICVCSQFDIEENKAVDQDSSSDILCFCDDGNKIDLENRNENSGKSSTSTYGDTICLWYKK